MYLDVALIGHLATAIAFLVLGALLAVSWQRGAIGAILLVACVVTIIWSALAAYDAWHGGAVQLWVGIFEVLRTAAWLSFLLGLLFLNRAQGRMPAGFLAIPITLAAAVLAVIAVDVVPTLAIYTTIPGLNIDAALFGRFVLAVAGLLCLENLWRNTHPDQRWSIKFLCLGVGGLFAYDFFMYADALLFHRIDPDLMAARGITGALAVPLIAVSARRNPAWSLDIFVSRQVVFHSATLMGAGVYLLAMAGAGFYLREVGGEWGAVLQSIFLFAAILLLLTMVSSGRSRARLKRFIATHFFSYKYDYRDEWLRFIAMISESGTGASLPLRVIQGIANIVESTGGAIWLNRGGDHFALLESWSCVVPEGEQTVDPSFVEALEVHQAVLDLDNMRNSDQRVRDIVLPGWLSGIRRARIIVPMIHNDRLLGFLLLGEPRIRLDIDAEDFALLKTVAKQAASYLAERQSAEALAETHRFSDFNRRFAFVLHDIKNLVSQLSLIVQNADKHRNNPIFQEDMLKTVAESVDKMNRLMVRLHEGGKGMSTSRHIELDPMLRRIVELRAGTGNISFRCDGGEFSVDADDERLHAVFSHIVQNSLDAAGVNGHVTVELAGKAGEAVIEITDDGPGMEPEFVRNEMFRPFRTTKSGGFGIGAYESREFVRELGGRLDVSSRPGEGTTVRISLPVVNAGDGHAEQLREVRAK